MLDSASELMAFIQTASAALDVDVQSESIEDNAEAPKVQGILTLSPLVGALQQ